MNELGTPREILDWDPGDAVFISNSLLDLLHDLGSVHHLSAAILSCSERCRAWCDSQCLMPDAGVSVRHLKAVQLTYGYCVLPSSATNIVISEIFVSNVTAKGIFYISNFLIIKLICCKS